MLNVQILPIVDGHFLDDGGEQDESDALPCRAAVEQRERECALGDALTHTRAVGLRLGNILQILVTRADEIPAFLYNLCKRLRTKTQDLVRDVLRGAKKLQDFLH